MTRRVFYSFHYDLDNWRAAQVRNIGAIYGNSPATDNNWEAVKRGGDQAIKRWIAGQMRSRSCTVVLVGSRTAGRKWIDYEIEKSWNDGMGVVGIYIHGLEDRDGRTSTKGKNPFDAFTLNHRRTKLSSVAKCYNPGGKNGRERYAWISRHLANAVEEAIRIRNSH